MPSLPGLALSQNVFRQECKEYENENKWSHTTETVAREQLALLDHCTILNMAVGHSLAKSVFVVGAKRTPFGTFGGALKSNSM